MYFTMSRPNGKKVLTKQINMQKNAFSWPIQETYTINIVEQAKTGTIVVVTQLDQEDTTRYYYAYRRETTASSLRFTLGVLGFDRVVCLLFPGR